MTATLPAVAITALWAIAHRLPPVPRLAALLAVLLASLLWLIMVLQ